MIKLLFGESFTAETDTSPYTTIQTRTKNIYELIISLRGCLVFKEGFEMSRITTVQTNLNIYFFTLSNRQIESRIKNSILSSEKYVNM